MIVNRVWQYHFGRGLVDTPNDFGQMGQQPTHPELLDWLAAEFRDRRQSLKKLHRLIVTSATYRAIVAPRPGRPRRSTPTTAALAAEPHAARRRAVRDAVLPSAAGSTARWAARRTSSST